MKVRDRVRFRFDGMTGIITNESKGQFYVLWDDDEECWCDERELEAVE